MKKIFMLAIGLMVTVALSAQMTVWSNGQSVYNSAVENVDSISFASAAPGMVVAQSASGQGITTLEGKVYLYSIAGLTSSSSSSGTIVPTGLAFYSASEGAFFNNGAPNPSTTSSTKAHVVYFTYSINYPNITINLNNQTCTGKIIGTKAIIFDLFPAFLTVSDNSGITFFAL